MFVSFLGIGSTNLSKSHPCLQLCRTHCSEALPSDYTANCTVNDTYLQLTPCFRTDVIRAKVNVFLLDLHFPPFPPSPPHSPPTPCCSSDAPFPMPMPLPIMRPYHHVTSQAKVKRELAEEARAKAKANATGVSRRRSISESFTSQPANRKVSFNLNLNRAKLYSPIYSPVMEKR